MLDFYKPVEVTEPAPAYVAEGREREEGREAVVAQKPPEYVR